MRRALMLTLLVLAAGLAGCAGQENGTDPDDGSADGDTGETGTPLPSWELGDTWTYQVNDPAFGQQTVRLLNYKDDGAHYWLGAETKRKAVLHSVYSSIPVLGRIHIDNLAPHENGTHAAMYAFPLEDGKRWTGPLYGYQFNFKATATEIDTPEGPSPGYKIEGIGPSAEINFDYAENVEWFTKMVLSDKSGKELLRVTLTGYQKGNTGPYHFMRADDFAKVTLGNTGVTGQQEGFTVPSRPSFGLLYVGLQGSWETSANVQVRNPDGEVEASWSRGFGGSGEVGEPEIVEITNPMAGEWTLEYSSQGNSDLDIRVVGVKQYDSGTYSG